MTVFNITCLVPDDNTLLLFPFSMLTKYSFLYIADNNSFTLSYLSQNIVKCSLIVGSVLMSYAGSVKLAMYPSISIGSLAIDTPISGEHKFNRVESIDKLNLLSLAYNKLYNDLSVPFNVYANLLYINAYLVKI